MFCVRSVTKLTGDKLLIALTICGDVAVIFFVGVTDVTVCTGLGQYSQPGFIRRLVVLEK